MEQLHLLFWGKLLSRSYRIGRRDEVRIENLVPQAEMSAPYLATNVMLVLSFLAPAIIIYATPAHSEMFGYIGPLLIAALAGIRFAVIVGSRTRRLYEMVVWLFTYVFLGIAPLIQMRLGADTDTAPFIDHTLDWTSALLVLFGCLPFLVGVLLYQRRKQEPLVDENADWGVNPARANLLTLAALAIFAYYVSKIGVSSLFLSRTGIDNVRLVIWPDKTVNSMIVGATSMGLLVSTIAQMYVRRQCKAAGKPRPWLMPFVSFVALFLSVNPVNSARYIFGTVMLAMLGAFGAYATPKRFRLVSISAIFGLVYLFPIADMFRRSLDPTAKSQNPLESMLSGDFDSFSQVTNTVEYVNEHGITWGNQLLGVLFFWLPRSIWPDKAIDTGTLLGEFKVYFFKNLSAPLWAEFYINGGWVLLILGMFALGLLVGRLDERAEAALARTGYPGLTACIVPFYLLIVLRGSLLQSVAFMSVIAVSCVFVGQGKPKPVREAKPHKRGARLSPAYAKLDRNTKVTQ